MVLDRVTAGAAMTLTETLSEVMLGADAVKVAAQVVVALPPYTGLTVAEMKPVNILTVSATAHVESLETKFTRMPPTGAGIG